MGILALDLGTNCGWAYLDQAGLVLSGTWDLAPASQRRWEGGGMRYVRFVDYLRKLPKPERVAYEEVRRHKGVDAAHAYGGFQAALMSWCEAEGIPYEAYPVGMIKKHATGKGNANKEAMIESAQRKWAGTKVEDDNQADALWLLDLVRNSTK